MTSLTVLIKLGYLAPLHVAIDPVPEYQGSDATECLHKQIIMTHTNKDNQPH